MSQLQAGAASASGGPFEQCDPIYYAGYGSSYRNNYYTGFVTRGVCSGRGMHLACNVLRNLLGCV
ncbi:MAG: hypothetical protein WAL36_10400 [Pseudolabrys sp.]